MTEEDKLTLWVDNFTHEMKAKLIKKFKQGYQGWEGADEKYLLQELKRHVEKKDWIDVADFAMFLWAKEKVKP